MSRSWRGRAAEELHQADFAVTSAIFYEDVTNEEWTQIQLREKVLRERFIDEARRSLGFGAGSAIGLHQLVDSEDLGTHA